MRKEWESLRSDDVVFLLAVKGIDETDKIIAYDSAATRLSLVEQYGIKCLRAAEVVAVMDSHGRHIGIGENKVRHSAGQCRLHLKLDTDMFQVGFHSTPSSASSCC